jgi:hypothetical protein
MTKDAQNYSEVDTGLKRGSEMEGSTQRYSSFPVIRSGEAYDC